jgi:ABC-type branched-subunit amino acid transport system ATPase component/ABC-type branched-subunit amino acid transport system permease subunit
MCGVNPKLVSTMVWAIAGGVSTVTLVLIAGAAGSGTSITTLGPDTLVRALAAAVIGGMGSFRKATIAGVVIGVAEAIVGFRYLDQPGLIDFLVFVAVLIAVWLQSREGGSEAVSSFSFSPKRRPIPQRLARIWWIRLFDKSGIVLLLLIGVLAPIVITQPSRQLLYATILAFAICGCSLTILTGWGGLVSLGQMAFAGLGALIAAGLTHGLSLNIGWGSHRLINTEFTGEPFWLSIVIASAVTGLIAAIIGIGSLRVRGLLLAVTTFAFALAAEEYLYNRPLLNGHANGTVIFGRGKLFGLDFTQQRTYYYAVLVVLVLVLMLVARLRRSGVGRSIIAVRDNPDSATAYTLSVQRSKMKVFALSGVIAGLGGAMLSGVVQQVPYSEQFFLVNDSLVLVSLVVIGGLGATTGPVLGALWIIGLPAFGPSSSIVALLVSSIGLLLLLLYFPTGLVGIAYKARDAVIDWAERRMPEPESQPRADASVVGHGRPEPDIASTAVPTAAVSELATTDRGDVLVAEHMSVRFGGVHAVDDVSIRLAADEIVGLIGANGAGKSTLMNAIGGYVHATGDVTLLGGDVSHASAAARARAGLGRTFQAARLFPELTVRESILVSLEARSHTSLLATATFWPGQIRAERAKRAEASEIMSFVGLGRYAEHYLSDLSTGTRRIVELAGLLAMGAEVLFLDEPTAGVAQRETEAFGPLLLEVRRELGAAMLVIEHDMPLIMSISDRVYCLEAGKVIAEGSPDAVRNNPRVIASYLGTDERAIARSGAAVT